MRDPNGSRITSYGMRMRFYLCLTEGYKKGYISFHHFENCVFVRFS